MVRFSIIIPYLGDERGLDDTLVSVLENRPPRCEIIVVHNVAYGDPYQLAGEVRFVAAPAKATPAECLNLGLSVSRGPIVHLLACGIEVAPDWAEQAVRRLADADVASVATVVVGKDDRSRIISAGLGYRAEGVARRLVRGVETAELCGPDVRAAFYCRSALEEIGGFSDEASDLLMGVEAALRLRRLGFRSVMEPECCLSADAERIDDRPGFRFGRDAERLFFRWASSCGWTRSLLGHAALTVGECTLGLRRPALLAQVAGRMYGAILAALVDRRGRPRCYTFGVRDDGESRYFRAA